MDDVIWGLLWFLMWVGITVVVVCAVGIVGLFFADLVLTRDLKFDRQGRFHISGSSKLDADR
jgi:hypothetical protein